VKFSRQGGAFRATIRMAGGSVRVLEDRAPSCASLEQATALTLALLLDSDAHELTIEEHQPGPRKSQPAVKPAPSAPFQPPAPREEPQLVFAVGGGALFGVVQTVAPIATADVGLYLKRFHTSLGVLWMPTQQQDLAPGQLRESLVSGVARTCYAPLLPRKLRVETCTGFYAGLLNVEARGYTRNDTLGRAWLAVPVELSLSTAAPPMGVELGFSALLPLRQSDFAIDNLGTAYASWPLGMLVTLRAQGRWVL
jgi:hypothetical protein